MSTTDKRNREGYLRGEKAAAIVLLIIMLITLPKSIAAPPAVAAEFFGNAIIDGESAPAGTDVAVFSDGKMCGRYVIRTEGRYGFMSCNSAMLKDVRFEMNGKEAKAEYITEKNVNIYLESYPYRMPKEANIVILIAFLVIISYLIWREKKRR